jgi:hypothetical protein
MSASEMTLLRISLGAVRARPEATTHGTCAHPNWRAAQRSYSHC